MIIFLYGPDSYRRQQKLNEIKEDFKKKHSGFALEKFDLNQESELGKLKDFVKSQSLFDALRLGIIAGGSSLDGALEKEFRNLLKENLKSKDPVLIVVEDKKPVKDFKFLLEKPVLSQEFQNLAGAEFQKFLQQETQKRNLNLDANAKSLLAQVYGGDSWGLITELDKIALLDEKSINAEILKHHLEAFLPVNIFSTINQIRNSGNLSARLSLLEELLFRNEDAAMIFNILAVSPYADQKWKNLVADYDASVKSGKLEYEEALTDLVISE